MSRHIPLYYWSGERSSPSEQRERCSAGTFKRSGGRKRVKPEEEPTPSSIPQEGIMTHTRPTIEEVVCPELRSSDREDILIFNVIRSARTLEEFLWGVHNQLWGLEEWKRMFRKRVEKIDNIDPANPHWRIELRKRLMQNAALSVAMMRLLDEDKIYFEGVHPSHVPSNLEKYKEPL